MPTLNLLWKVLGIQQILPLCNLHSNGGNISNQSPSLLSPKSSVAPQSSGLVFSIEFTHSTATFSFLSCLLLLLLQPVHQANLMTCCS